MMQPSSHRHVAREIAMLRVINTALLLAAVCGGLFALRAERARRELAREHRRLAAKVGFLSVDDEHKVHVQALPTDDPLHFAWQIYFPAEYEGEWRSTFPTGSFVNVTASQEAHREIVRLRFRRIQDRWHLWITFGKSSISQEVEGSLPPILAQPRRLRVEQLGTGQPKAIDVDELTELIRITSDGPDADADNPLLVVQFGTPQAWAKEETSGGH